MCGSRISLIRYRMKVGGTYGTVIAYQKVGAQAGKKEEAKGKLNSGSKPSLWEKHFAYDPRAVPFKG
jgi:hypothetical protein